MLKLKLSTTRAARARLAVLTLLASVAAAAPAKFVQAPPEGFRPLDLSLTLESGASVAREPQVFDLGTGIVLSSCPAGVWTGRASFVGLAGGTIEFDGQFFRCLPFGAGTATYPNGTRYVGTVNSYLKHSAAPGLLLDTNAANFRLDANSVRVAVREGKGSATKSDGTQLDASFVRGEAVEPAKDKAGKQALRLKAFDAALAVLALNANTAVEAEQRAARLVTLANSAKEQATVERAAADKARVVEQAKRESAAQAEVGSYRDALLGNAEFLAAPVVASTAVVASVAAGDQPGPLDAPRRTVVEAAAYARQVVSEIDLGKCGPDQNLIPAFVQAQGAWANQVGGIMKPISHEQARKSFDEYAVKLRSYPPLDELKQLVERNDQYFAKIGGGAHSINGLIQISDVQARMSYSQHLVHRGIMTCVVQRKTRAAAFVAEARSGDVARVAATRSSAVSGSCATRDSKVNDELQKFGSANPAVKYQGRMYEQLVAQSVRLALLRPCSNAGSDEDYRIALDQLVWTLESCARGTDSCVIDEPQQRWVDAMVPIAQRVEGTAAGAPVAKALDPAARACAAAYAGQERYFHAINMRRPRDVTLVPDFQTVMYMLDARLMMLDTSCKGQPEYEEYASVVAARTQADRSCKALTSSPDVCQPEIAW